VLSCVVVFDGRVTRVDLWRHTQGFARILREIYSQTAVVVLKNSFRN